MVSRTDNGWSWLSVKFKEIRANKFIKARKGELPPELIKAIWGSHNLRLCQLSGDSFKGISKRKTSIDPELEVKKVLEKRQDESGKVKPAENLMDILLHNWTYFEHAHSTLGKTNKKVHAKYCEDEFGHFLLSDGKQIHGQFNVNLTHLIKELRKLLTKLRSQILPIAYQELPSWKSPRLEEDPELEIPPMPPMPQLYPISGLAPIPSAQEENIPNDYPSPVFKSPIPREHPPLVLPEPLKVSPLKLPVMPAFTEDESTIDYDAYREESLPVFELPPQEPLPVWAEPQLAELPPEPEYLLPQSIPPPIMESMPPFRPPLLDPRPCERSYYQVGKDEKSICDGLCSKHGHKHHFIPGQNRREPCHATPPQFEILPPPPFPEADSIINQYGLQDTKLGEHVAEIQIIPEPTFEVPPEEVIPPFCAPKLKDDPVFMPLSPPYLPSWKEPKPPPPVGWMGGQRPVFLVDCSGGMAGERMAGVQECLRCLFRPGGQAEIAITHFDIIMYSFDAWSFGDIENSYVYKAAGSRYIRPLEPMRVKSPEMFEAALNWVSRWHPTGPSNLSKAIDLAMSRTSADCIYLFSEGKSDKPVLIIESLKRQAQARRYSIPIYTVGMHTNKMRCRFLRRLSAVTGGQFVEYDFKGLQQTSVEGKEEDLADLLWAMKMIEDIQRKNAESGRTEDIRDIIKYVESKYATSRHTLYIESHKNKINELKIQYQKDLERVRKENAELQLRAKQEYERLVSEIHERNKNKLEIARSNWEEEIKKVKERNKQMLEDILKWKEEVTKVKQMNDRMQKDARAKFLQDLKEVEERNIAAMEKAKEQHMAHLESIKKKHMEGLEEVARKQKESNEKVASINKVIREDYEVNVKAVKESNALILSQARKLHEEKLENVKTQNAKAIFEAQKKFEKQCEEVRVNNTRKQASLQQLLESIKTRKEQAVLAHKAEVARAISLHEEKIKAYNKMNLENEEKARKAWKKECENIDKENMAAVRKAMDDFEAEQLRVQEENVKLAERRLDLKRRIAQIVRENDEIVKRKKVEWKEACGMVEKQYEIEVAKAKEAHKEKIEQVKLKNAEKLQSSLLEHKAKVAAAESYNETVRPYVEASNAVRAEIRRIEAFLQVIADSILPQDRHIMEKSATKSPLEKDLDLLVVSNATLNTELLIEALRSAYGKKWKADKKQSQKMSTVPEIFGSKTKFSSLMPIHPARAVPHKCLDLVESNT
ncbi:hypothetical protein KP509_09G016200 [Ceratopteris richardii]|nr:hypothetical protein KP509_09G016200 [Ceratopteris richardii]